jgi:peptide/nickel transport system ATP-binding protein
MDPLVRVENLTIRLPPGGDRAHAIEDVSFTVNEGEIVCVVGESGSGKSVTASAVLRLLPRGLAIASGRISFAGEDLLAASAARMRDLRGREISMIFQEPLSALNPVMRVGNQVAELMEAHGAYPGEARRARTLALFDYVGLPEPVQLIEAYPFQISGGQRQRVMIAMALALEPKLILADEPTTALDVTTQKQILELLRKIRKERGTALLSSPMIRSLIAAVPRLRPAALPAPGDQVVLSVEGLQKTFGGGASLLRRRRKVVAVKDVRFSVRRGETLGIVGESGSGKSTLARCLVRLVEPEQGRIVFDGHDVRAISRDEFRPLRRRLQMVFQDPFASLNPRKRVRTILTDGPRAHGTPAPDAQARAAELLSLVGLDASALDRFPHEFSGGQRQRIGIARALMMDPEVIVADEPVSALDVSVQAQVLELLDGLQRRLRLAMVFITHDLRVAARLCHTLAVMHRGEIVETGPAGDIFAAPQHPYTRQLLAALPGRHLDERP